MCVFSLMNKTTGYEPVDKGLIPLRRSKGSRVLHKWFGLP